MEFFDITKYTNIALRRKYWIIIPFLISVLIGLFSALRAPKIYEARTLILVQPQRVPQNFVRPIVQTDIRERLRTITQQVLSRTNLESIIKEHQLYSGTAMIPEEKVELLRKQVSINVGGGSRSGGSTFEISFRGGEPVKVMKVTNALASNFISENLKVRESQAIGTSAFLADELESVERRLMKKEKELKEYRQKYMGALPSQLQTNLSILGRLQRREEQLNSKLMDAQNRKLIIQQQMAQTEMMRKQMAVNGLGDSLVELDTPLDSQDQDSGNLAHLKKQVALLETKYTVNHPDVRRLNRMIEKIEAEKSSAGEDKEDNVETTVEEDKPGADSIDIEPVVPVMNDQFKPQLHQINLEIKDINAKIRKVQTEIGLYQQRVEETPKREQEMISLNRDYGNLKDLYGSLLNRKLEAEIALSMEKKQKGEQFRIIDPAKVPELSMVEDLYKTILLSLVLGLGLGAGLAYLIEIMDTSFKAPDELEKELKVSVLVSMPIRYTEQELKMQKRKKVLVPCSVAMGFILAASVIVLNVKGVDGTLNYIKNLFANI